MCAPPPHTNPREVDLGLLVGSKTPREELTGREGGPTQPGLSAGTSSANPALGRKEKHACERAMVRRLGPAVHTCGSLVGRRLPKARCTALPLALVAVAEVEL